MPTIPIKTKEKVLCITDIFKDEGIYPREIIDEARIDFFSELIREGTIFPPIKIVREESGRYLLLDGFHRYSAFKKLERPDIACHLIDAEPHFWRLLAVRFNFDSSKPLQHGEIKRAINAAWCKDEIRDKQQIADMVGRTVQWVRRVVKAIEKERGTGHSNQYHKTRERETPRVQDVVAKTSMINNNTSPEFNPELWPVLIRTALSKRQFRTPNGSSKILTVMNTNGSRTRKRPCLFSRGSSTIFPSTALLAISKRIRIGTNQFVFRGSQTICPKI